MFIPLAANPATIILISVPVIALIAYCILLVKGKEYKARILSIHFSHERCNSHSDTGHDTYTKYYRVKLLLLEQYTGPVECEGLELAEGSNYAYVTITRTQSDVKKKSVGDEVTLTQLPTGSWNFGSKIQNAWFLVPLAVIFITALVTSFVKSQSVG